jgi:hypothetical protein
MIYCVWKFSFKCFFFQLRDMNSLAVNHGSPRNRPTTQSLSDFSDRSPREGTVLCRSSQIVAIDEIYNGVFRFGNFRRIFGDSFQYWLNIRRRACNDTQNLAGRGLLLQRFGEVTVACL